MFFFGGGKCPNLGVVNVRILGVGNVRLANNLTPVAVDAIFVSVLFALVVVTNSPTRRT